MRIYPWLFPSRGHALFASAKSPCGNAFGVGHKWPDFPSENKIKNFAIFFEICTEVKTMALYYFGNHPHATRADGSKINTKSHYEYICREGRFSRMEDKAEELAYVCSGNMPEWAETAGKFWDTAEKNRRVHGRAYREIRMGLQEELSLDDNIAMVEEFLEKSGIGKNHAFTYAIHDKTAAFDKGHRNIHVHLMFCEKMIEKDRPIGPDLYFKQYAVDRGGNPCSGYKADRFYHDRHGTYAMRKMWADIVNAKFKERGLDISITEKSLAVQRKELLEQGRNEEAELLDRKPAPHLGDSYKNPRTLERIQETIEKIDTQVEDPAVSDKEKAETDKQKSIYEQKLVMFATDALLRRTINELRHEYERVRREELQQEAARAVALEQEDELQELEDNPVIVTAADVYEKLKLKAEDYQKKINQNKAAYADSKKQIIPDKIIRSVATERVLGNEYKNIMRQYKRILEELKPMKEKEESLIKVPFEDKKEFIKVYVAAINKKNQLAERVAAYQKMIYGSKKEVIEEAIQEIKKSNAKHTANAKKIYRDIQILSNKQQKIEIKKTELVKHVPADKILYSGKLHDVVLRDTKINGKFAVKEYPLVPFNGKAYAVLELPDNASRQAQPITAKAVMLGDKTIKGKAPVYMLSIQCYQNGKLQVYSSSKTQETIRTYALRNNGKMIHSPAANQIHQKAFTSKLNQIMDKALDENTNGKYNAWWQDEDDQRKDKVQQAEQEMYKGWSL